jgi:hypothetical protein
VGPSAVLLHWLRPQEQCERWTLRLTLYDMAVRSLALAEIQDRLGKSFRRLLRWVVANVVEPSPLVGAGEKPLMFFRCLLRVYAIDGAMNDDGWGPNLGQGRQSRLQ